MDEQPSQEEPEQSTHSEQGTAQPNVVLRNAVLATWVICSQNRRFQHELTSDKHPRKPTHKVRKNRKDAKEFRS
jgi:hypothetical protein